MVRRRDGHPQVTPGTQANFSCNNSAQSCTRDKEGLARQEEKAPRVQYAAEFKPQDLARRLSATARAQTQK